MEEIEKENIQRKKSAIGADDRDEQKDVIFFDAFFDGRGYQNSGERSSPQKQQEQGVDPVNAQMIGNPKRNDPGNILDELKTAGHMIVSRINPDRQDKRQKDGNV